MGELMYPLGGEQIKITRSGNVAIVTMDVPARKNAFSLKMRHELISSIRQLMYFDDCRALVLTGAGGVFSSGGDITEMRKRTHMEVRERIDLVSQLVRLILTGPKPVVAAVEGPAFGAGWSLTLASDYAVAATDAKFCAAFIRVGLVPDTGLFWSLIQRIGRTKAKQYMTLATEITGSQALAQGLVDEAVEPGAALARAIEVGEQYARMPPLTVGLIKEAVMNRTDSLADAIKAEIDFQAVAMGTSDHQEAIQAFREKRKPVFKGE